jgi:hypothetical protein
MASKIMPGELENAHAIGFSDLTDDMWLPYGVWDFILLHGICGLVPDFQWLAFFFGKNVATASDAKDKKGKKNASPS